MGLQQPQLLQIPLNQGDVVYTPDWVARDMVEFFQPSGRILDPCRGDGAFTKYLPGAEWCEIQDRLDFFAWREPVDWVIGNPPYGLFTEWIDHSFDIASHVCYLIPMNKAFNSSKFFNIWSHWGKIIHMRFYASGGTLGFPIGFAIGAVYFQKGYMGPMFSSIYEGERE